jgi:hypothetical protein
MSDPDFSDLGEPEASLAAGIFTLEYEDPPGLPDDVKENMTEAEITEAEAKIAVSSEESKKQIEDRARGMTELISEFVRTFFDDDDSA